MPSYNPPFIKPQLLQKGVPAYLFGNLNMLRSNGSGTVINDALTSNVATVTIQVSEGGAPQVGDLITIYGTALQSGLFNVTRALVTAVAIDAQTGQGTVSYALTGTNQATTADPGRFIMEIGESSETLAAGYSQPVLVQAPQCDSQFTIPLTVTFPTMPTDVTCTLQKAIRDLSAEYTNTSAAVVISASAYTAGPTVEATLERGYFYRLAVTGLTGAGTIIAKVG